MYLKVQSSFICRCAQKLSTTDSQPVPSTDSDLCLCDVNECEQVSRGEDDVAMAFGREVLSQGARSPDEQELLSETLSLIAYPEPSRSPCGHLLGVQHRTELATSLNAAIFAFKGRKTESALETIYRQLVRGNGCSSVAFQVFVECSAVCLMCFRLRVRVLGSQGKGL